MIGAEEVANLSPAKHCRQVAVPVHSSSLVSQSSLGFCPIPSYPNNQTDKDSSDSGSGDSSSDSEFNSEVEALSRRHHNLEASEVLGGSHPGQSTEQLNFLRKEKAATPIENSALGSQLVGNLQREHEVAQQHYEVKSHKRKRKYNQSADISAKKPVKVEREFDKRRISPVQDTVSIKTREPDGAGNTKLATGISNAETVSSLLVKIPLSEVKVSDTIQLQLKPKATVEPYNVRSTSFSRTAHHRNIGGDVLPEQEEGRDRYSRLRLDEYASSSPGAAVHDFHGRGERSRVHTGARWERDHRSYISGARGSGRGGGGGDYGRGHGWGEGYRVSGGGGGDEYWPEGSHYETGRVENQRAGGAALRGYPPRHGLIERKNDPEYYMQEARRRKKEADKITVIHY